MVTVTVGMAVAPALSEGRPSSLTTATTRAGSPSTTVVANSTTATTIVASTTTTLAGGTTTLAATTSTVTSPWSTTAVTRPPPIVSAPTTSVTPPAPTDTALPAGSVQPSPPPTAASPAPAITPSTEASTVPPTEPPTDSLSTDVSTTGPSASEVPVGALTPPPVGEELAPAPGPPAIDPVAAAAQLAYDAFVPWRAAGQERTDASDDVRAAADNPDVPPEQQAAAADSLVAAQLALSSAAPVYREARDALADAVVARAGRVLSDGVRLSAIWERTDPRRLAVVFAALMHVGDPYVFGMSGPDQFDCSGLTRSAWRTVGVDLVHYAVTQRQQSLDVTPDGLQPGDLAFRFRRPGGHVMLYLGLDDLVVQAGGAATGVVVTPWGSIDALGSPLAAPVPPDPEAPPPPSSFGRTARSRIVGDDIPFGDPFNAAGARYEVAPELLAAIASVTGGYRTETEMGLRPAVVAGMGLDRDDPYAVIDGAAERLVDLYLVLGDERAALAAYPTSLGAVTDITAVPDDLATTAFVDAVGAVLRAWPT